MTVFTHTGWIGLCPIYFADENGVGATLRARHPALEWWLALNAFAMQGLLWLASTVGICCRGFPIRITGELKPPLELL